MRRTYLLIALAVAVIIGLAFGLKPGGSQVMPMGLMTLNLSRAKQIGIAAQLYAGDHGGVYPAYLDELVPDYLANVGLLLYSEPGGSFAPKYDWLYFAAGCDNKRLPHITIASPQAVWEGHSNKRIVVYNDLSVEIIREDQYQRELHQMIEAARRPSSADAPIGSKPKTSTGQ